MATNEQYIQVRNLTDNAVVYLIPEDNLRRVFGPNEDKLISREELKKLYYQPGGPTLIQDFLRINDKELAIEFGVDPDLYAHEYSWDIDKVDNVLLKEDIDVLHDALDFAPEGIIDLIVERAVALRIPDINRRELIYDCTGKNVHQMINNQIHLESVLGKQEEAAPKQRRAADANQEPSNEGSKRRAE